MKFHKLILLLLLTDTLLWTGVSAIAHGWICNDKGFWICILLFILSPILTAFAWQRYLWAGLSLYFVLLISVWLPPWVTADIATMVIESLMGLIFTMLWVWFSKSETEMENNLNKNDIISDVYKMLDSDAKLLEVRKKIWFSFNFHGGTPDYHDDLPEIGYKIYNKFKNDKTKDTVAHCMLLLGRIFNAKGEYLPACRFFLRAMQLFESEYHIIASEFFREELRSTEGKRQIKLSKNDFKEEFKTDTPEKLIKEYFPEQQDAYPSVDS